MAGITYKPLTTNTAARTGRHPLGTYAGLWDRKAKIIEREPKAMRYKPSSRYYFARYTWRELMS